MRKSISKIKASHLFRVFIFLLVILLIIVGRNFFFGAVNKSAPDSVSDTATKVRDYCVANAAASKGKENCYSEEFKKIAEQNGWEFSFQVLDSLQKIDAESIGCHLISHGIGWGSYKREPDTWRELVRNMPTSCNYGAIHGVLESYILSLPEKSLSREVIPTICGENPRADCNHIVGHLLLVQTDANVDKALDLCTVFTQPQQKSFCISGVFMEYQTALNLVAHDLVPQSWLNWPSRLGELEKLCRSYSGEFAEGCWEEIVHVALVSFNNDPKKIFDFCSTAQVPNGAKRCKRHSLGIIGASKNFELASLKSVCEVPQKDDPGFEQECYPAMVSSALSTVPGKVSEAVSFCNSLESKFQQSCFSMIGSMSFSIPLIKQLSVDACKKAPEEFQDYCSGSKQFNPGQYIIRSND